MLHLVLADTEDIPQDVRLALQAALAAGARLYIHLLGNRVVFTKPGVSPSDSFTIDSGPHVAYTKDLTVGGLAKLLGPDYICVMDPEAAQIPEDELGKKLAAHKDPMVVIGGFKSGTYKTRFSYPAFSLGPKLMKIWEVVEKVTETYAAAQKHQA